AAGSRGVSTRRAEAPRCTRRRGGGRGRARLRRGRRRVSPGPARARARASRWAVVMGLLVVGGLQAGCHARIPRLVAQGRHDEAIELAEAGRRRPRGKAARAWAAALVHAGRSDEAHAVLLKDFRRGGGVASLFALADLERAEGYDGLAAVHYARAFDLDARAVSGRT